MELSPYVDRLRSDLTDAAAAGGEETRVVAERLMLALDPATRMVLLEALSQAAAEITGELPRDAVDVRMVGREPEFVVTHVGDVEETAPITAAPLAPEPPAAPAPPEPPVDDSLSRITLRLPESVKTRAEEAAAADGLSLNSWLVDAVRAVLDGASIGDRVDLRLGRHSISVNSPTGGPGSGRRPNRVRGWVS
ncbi:toxin-antitoxin system HicB family antitoxin [Nocardioides mangrovicus]|uniref:Toxin-antitoxin system HicB family antitoxin n=1 Tax=Nocardioides mangrovicus TaxID=2478913 RepID=A0A3L8P5J8_9ACTN|nr:toxin-antitoxin system HicB family antitoxin [Nocardioides mangrovicus]RLV49919.1 toxin-antitoxin system HicB family antitoxin [Nocardioides mangrovicus]